VGARLDLRCDLRHAAPQLGNIWAKLRLRWRVLQLGD
jgi:hypothetical protein